MSSLKAPLTHEVPLDWGTRDTPSVDSTQLLRHLCRLWHTHTHTHTHIILHNTMEPSLGHGKKANKYAPLCWHSPPSELRQDRSEGNTPNLNTTHKQNCMSSTQRIMYNKILLEVQDSNKVQKSDFHLTEHMEPCSEAPPSYLEANAMRSWVGLDKAQNIYMEPCSEVPPSCLQANVMRSWAGLEQRKNACVYTHPPPFDSR